MWQPAILKPEYITVQHCYQFIAEKEGKISGTEKAKKGKPYDPISQEDIALHVVNRLYSFIPQFLNVCRVAPKAVFFEEHCLFLSWSVL